MTAEADARTSDPGVPERLLDDALVLCAVAAPTGLEAARAELMARMLLEAGLDVRRDDAGNVLARVGEPGPALVVAAHLDTVFPASTPLEPRRDGDVLRGPGIGDNAVALAAMLHLGRALATAQPRVPLLLAATVGEEGRGDLRGMRALLDDEEVTAAVAVEGHGLDSLVTGGVGSARYEAVYRGPGGHSWGDAGRPSAVHALFAAGTAAVSAAAPVAVNVGVVQGGTSVNTIAPEARLEIDLRSEDEVALSAAARRVEGALRRVPDGVTVELRPIGRRPGGTMARGHPLLRAARAARAAVGLPPATEESASTDANAAYGRGIPAVAVGLTTGDHVHRVDEWIHIAPLGRGVAALERLVRTVTGA